MLVRHVVAAALAGVTATALTLHPALAQETPTPEPTVTATAEPTAEPTTEPTATVAPTEAPDPEPTEPDFSEEEPIEIPVTIDRTSGAAGALVTFSAPCEEVRENVGAAFLAADQDGEEDTDYTEITDITVGGGTATARFTIPSGSAAGDALFLIACGDAVGGVEFEVLAASTDGGGSVGGGDGGTGTPGAKPARAVRGEARFTG